MLNLLSNNNHLQSTTTTTTNTTTTTATTMSSSTTSSSSSSPSSSSYSPSSSSSSSTSASSLALRHIPSVTVVSRFWLVTFYMTCLCVVPDLPRVLSLPLRIHLPKGMSGRILCPVEANPPVTLIVWTKNEHVIDTTHTTRVKLGKDGTLLIKSVTEADEGRYTCTPYSPLGAGRSSTVVQIIVRGEYKYSIFLLHNDVMQPGEKVTLAGIYQYVKMPNGICVNFYK